MQGQASNVARANKSGEAEPKLTGRYTAYDSQAVNLNCYEILRFAIVSQGSNNRCVNVPFPS
jgi:hypothetical protein